MAATLKDIAARVGVHTSTVSRVLRNKETQQVSPETRLKILSVAKELNYSANHLARALRLKKTHTIALIIPDISNAFFAGIAKVIERKSYEYGYNLVVCNTDEEQQKETRYLDNLIKRHVDGVIITPVNHSSTKSIDLLKKVPFVLIDRYFDDYKTNAVISNNEEISYKATSYLASFNHQKIGFICSRKSIYTIKYRLKGYYNAVKEFQLDDDKALICGNGHTAEAGYQATRTLLSQKNAPTAIISSGNVITIGVMKAIRERNLKIPNDISLIAFSDTPCAPYWSPPVTTISHPIEEMGNKAINLLLENIDNQKESLIQTVIVKAKFNKRESVDKPHLI